MKIVTADITGSLIVNGVDVTNNVVSSSVFSGSIAGRVTSLEQFSASLDATFATDASVTASILVLSQSVQASQAALSSSYTATSSSYVAVSASYSATSASYLTTSASYAAASASLSVRVTNTEATASTNTQASASFAAQSASLSTRLTTDETNITTLTNASASFANQSASLSTRLTTDETNYTNLSSSFATTSGSISGRVITIESKYATTGSNTFTGAQYISNTTNPLTFTTTASLYTDGGLRVSKDSFISGTAYFNNVVVYGTSSIQYITSSQVNIGANIINLNTQVPAQRYGGMAVADSGSNAGVTGSMLWDSVNNGWIYARESGSTYSGGALISGPRTSVQGNEQGTTSCMLLVGQGGDHLTSSMIYHDSSATCFYGQSYISSSGAACFASVITGGSDILLSAANPFIYGGTAVGGAGISNNTGASYIKIFGASHATTPNNIAFINANSTTLTINTSGQVGIGTPTPCSILHVYGSNPSLIVQNSAVAAVGNTANIFFRNLLSTGCIQYTGYIAGIQQSTSANTGDLSFNTYNNGSVIEGMRITSAGVACFVNTIYVSNNTGGTGLSMINTAAPNITGIGSATRGMIINGLSTSAAATGASFYFYGATNSYTSLTSGDLFQVTNNDAVKFNLSYAGVATFASTVCTPSLIACTTSAAAITIDGYSKLSFKDRGTEYGTINASRYNFGGECIVMTFQSDKCFLFLNGTNCLMFIGSNGNVGICNTGAATRLGLNNYVGARLPYINGTSNTYDANGITVGNSNNNNTNIGGGIDFTNNFYSVGSYSPILSFSSVSSNTAFNNSYAGMWGVFQGAGGDANWNKGDLVLGTSAAYGMYERMRITAAGNVGVGTCSPQRQFVISNGGAAGMELSSSTASTTIISYNRATSTWLPLILQEGTGNVLIGTTCDAGYKLNVNGTLNVASSLNVASTISAGGTISTSGNLNSTTQGLLNSAGNYAKMVHKVQGAAGAFSNVIVCASLNGAGGWGYIINQGGTGGGAFQAGGGYTNGTGNFGHNIGAGCGFTVSSVVGDVIRFVGPGGTHPFVSIQMFGSLNQSFDDTNICIYYV